MRTIVSPKRILGLLVLSLSLHAVWPASDFNSRLELFNPTAAPVKVKQSEPTAYGIRLRRAYTGLAGVQLRASAPRPQFLKGQIVYAAIPLYQKTLAAAATSQIIQVAQEPNLYAGCVIPRASGRAPPSLNA